MSSVTTVLEIRFQVLEPDPETGRHWITAQAASGEPMEIGFIVPFGDAMAAHGSAEGWPRIDVRADATRALCAVIAAWGQQVAESPDGGDEDGASS
ncbi:hypothetical protein AB0M39_41490 [Streptomyces sp. NPDC051907]|uniref:hypothetical protein n=1 Tax=Streptomyces sp. NPDC051907 TaxID=3155284 RepID=UPI0034458106